MAQETSRGPDWGVGHYENTAAQLLPAAQVVVDSAELQAGERVLDLGCGTGNAALLAADHDVTVTGVDPAARLLEVARDRAAAAHKDISFLSGDAAAIPLDDASVDVVLSVFAIIFAGDPVAAAAEVSRVLTTDGRLVLSSWPQTGAMVRMAGLAMNTIRQATGAPAPPAMLSWHIAEDLTKLLAPHGFQVKLEEHSLAVTAPSARQYLDKEFGNHPLAVAGLPILEKLGQAETLRARALELLEDANEDPHAFRITNPYVVAIARR